MLGRAGFLDRCFVSAGGEPRGGDAETGPLEGVRSAFGVVAGVCLELEPRDELAESPVLEGGDAEEGRCRRGGDDDGGERGGFAGGPAERFFCFRFGSAWSGASAGPGNCQSIPCCFLSRAKSSLRASRSSFLLIFSGWWYNTAMETDALDAGQATGWMAKGKGSTA